MKLLDCTMRDGGYYNDWDFDLHTVSKYILAMNESKVDFIELGFRFPDKNKFLGPFAHLSDEIIRSLPESESDIGVMINSADFINGKNKVSDYFDDRSNSPVSLVRLACHFKDVETSIDVAKEIKALGYDVGFNLMQCADKGKEELTMVGAIVQESDCIDVLYLADSFGDMNLDSLDRSFGYLRKSWHGECGFHAHNNKVKAVQNSMHALSIGVEWIDGTILGMGRGAGNAQTEYLLMELSEQDRDYFAAPVWDIVLKDFAKLHDKYHWGPNVLYYLSASYGVHPTYTQTFIDNGSDPIDILDSLHYLHESESSNFSAALMSESKYGCLRPGKGKWSSENWVKDKDVIIIGPGPEGLKHADAINRYAEKNDCFIIGLNHTVEAYLVDAFAMCHVIRLATQIENICLDGIPVLAPISLMPQQVQELFSNCEFLDYGLSVENDKFEANYCDCVMPAMLVAPYAMAAAISGGAKRILLVGFDGYDRNDPRYEEMEDVLSICCQSSTPIYAITPTLYKSVPQKSLYSL